MRHLIPLTPANRGQALMGVEVAIRKGQRGKPWVLELREPRRSDEQNRALWSLLGQIHKQRPTHNGVRMTPDLWKAVFMQALGAEMVMLPTLDGDGFFPLGHRSSQLTTAQFADLLSLILAWCAREEIEVKHFDDFTEAARDGEVPNTASPRAA